MIEVEDLGGASVFINEAHIVYIRGIYIDSDSNDGMPREDASMVVTTAGVILVKEEANGLLRRVEAARSNS